MTKWLWTQRDNAGPSVRRNHAMAFNSARGVAVLFGGFYWTGQPQMLGDTWTWDGNTWTQAQNAGPSARYGHAMAYDSIRDRIVLFGGLGATQLGDTWEWDGTDWTQVADSGPVPRSGHAMAFDPARGRTVLFGGPDPAFGGVIDSGTWEWDGADWTQVADMGPAPRAYAGMGFLAGPNVTCLFGGSGPVGAGVDGATWHWTGHFWTQAADMGPSARSNGALCGVALQRCSSQAVHRLRRGLATPGSGTALFGHNDRTWGQHRDDGTPWHLIRHASSWSCSVAASGWLTHTT